MGSYPMKDGVHDFDADATNTPNIKHSVPNSGMKAGVQDGVGFVDFLPLGALQAQQVTHSNVFRQEVAEESAGDGKNGKSFKFR